MTLPPPPLKHRLEASNMRFAHQLLRTKSYIDAVVPPLNDHEEAEANLQFCFQTLVLMLHTFMEEHFRLLISSATLWRTEDVRRFMAQRRPDHAERLEDVSAFELMRQAAREVSFKKRARQLKAIFAVLFPVGPFADADAEAKCFDLIQVRNIITHQGGLLEDDDVPQLHSPDVVVKRTPEGSLVFRQLHIQPQFLLDALAAMSRSVATIDESLKHDPRYSV